VPKKTQDFAFVIPGAMATYRYGASTKEFYMDYQHSFYAFTRPKHGWDCFRHWEIIAAGTVPYFFYLEHAPKQTLAHLPKSLLVQLRSLPGVPQLAYSDLMNAAQGTIIHII
jgi:hypothetical protein